MKSNREISVCVIGAGVCGIASVKSCLDAGFQVSCYEKSPFYGGLWHYYDERKNPKSNSNSNPSPTDGFIPTVMRTTILNTSKELSAFSDYPPPGNYPNFMKHSLYMKYLESYVNHFQLAKSIFLKHLIVNCDLKFNEEKQEFEWIVDIRDLEQDKLIRKYFDKLMIAVGHHNIPYMAKLKDQHKFKGKIIHSAEVKDVFNDDRFQDKKVLVVGFGNSACDLANDLALVTDKCFLSSHRGNWFLSRLNPNKFLLNDFQTRRRFAHYYGKYFPNLHDNWVERVSKKRFNLKALGLTPKHRPSEQTAAINDIFPFRVFTGGICMKSSVAGFTEHGVMFEGEEDAVEEIDLVVLATGYTVNFSFMKEFELGIKSSELNEYELYLNMFAPKLNTLNAPESNDEKLCLKAVKSLAVIGFTQPAGSITVVSELQARMAALVFEDKHQLPSIKRMVKQVEVARQKRAKSIRSVQREQLVGDWIGYLDEIAREIGVKPNMSKLFFKDFLLWERLMFGPSVSYQYRLSGPGSWDRAREAIMTVRERVQQGINDGKNHILFQNRRKRVVNAE